ncbi:MAG: hypothetical protein IJ656_02185 [Bacilli bacterium]|nr:hypothetical protein [Bacilli bacterium]
MVKIEDKGRAKTIEVTNKTGLKIVLCTYGASVFSLKVNDKPLILEFENFDEFLDSLGYHGKTLGRVAGRILSPIEIDGVKYELKKELDFPYALHGGSQTSLSYVNWDYKIKKGLGFTSVVFSILDKDLNNGFPGNVLFKITYKIFNNKNEFRLIQEAKTDKKTYINLSNHMYFSFSNDLNLSDYVLKMDASRYGDVRKDILITETKQVPEMLNFKEGAKLGEKLDIIEKESFLGTIDNTFLFDNSTDSEADVTLENQDFKLVLNTNYPAMNIYLDNSMGDQKFVNNKGINKRRAIALEPQLYDLELDSITFDKNHSYKYFINYQIISK